VLDAAGAPVPDALVEVWQADGDGDFPDADDGGFPGFGRCLVDDDGGYSFSTCKPGRVDGVQAPHVDLSVFARGLLQRVVTRVYFPDEQDANAADPVLASIDEARRSTLVAEPVDDGLRFDIHLAGERETVFFRW
jgi:protocatechuate 3,4-dioxygenase alpha subunit